MVARFIRWLNRQWYQGGWFPILFWPLGKLYCYLSQQRLATVKRRRGVIPTLVVGNLTVGGSGKTPLVSALVEHCRQTWRPVIISRGYRARNAAMPHLVETHEDAREVGDEPLALCRQTGVPVVIGPDRHADLALAINRTDADLAILDDGFQHLSLEPDLSLLVIEGQRGFGTGNCLPAGPLREPIHALTRADAIICHGKLLVDLPPLVRQKPFFHMHLTATGLRHIDAPEVQRELEWLQGRRVHAVAGIGHPERFFHHLRMLGAHVFHHPFPDHHVFTLRDFVDLYDAPIVMTAKDAVKCKNFSLQDAWVLDVFAELEPEFWLWLDQRLEYIRTVRGH